jgi:hypothetical protein
MQRSHAGTTLTSLQSQALTMLPKHNNLNSFIVFVFVILFILENPIVNDATTALFICLLYIIVYLFIELFFIYLFI